ncbi:regulator of hemoglobinization and erythroid cell expansion protein [Fukomys damarensis]|nr:regulator of hemoglobinization and erythroid cell expansion protein [Fukomys damarensis]XP_010611389.1 regulator of hemoglobinization and erythroid cell expansion protein [Fukomys damarensis]XP_033617887.1 regulator of hemoglobinization and erythroid cell expansion protein [Fukomys damarensis]XP_033617888.1 regulator of hemoglobinization and erythroid cell expansion protein [Fukomys damarensis]
MLARAMELWHGLAIAAVSLLLQACLLAVTGYLLSRHIARQSEQMLKDVRLQAQGSRPAHQPLPAAKETTETWTERSTPASVPRYKGESDTSSDSSDSSDGRDSSPPTCQVSKGVNYTQVVFSTPGGLSRGSALDYENMKDTTDYVNVNPKSPKPNSWTFSNPAVSEPVEYTQVVI